MRIVRIAVGADVDYMNCLLVVLDRWNLEVSQDYVSVLGLAVPRYQLIIAQFVLSLRHRSCFVFYSKW